MACLDTTVLLDLHGRGGRNVQARARRALEAIAARAEAVVTTRFNVAELYVGVERSGDPKAEAEAVERLLEEFEVLEFDDAAAHHFGSVTAHLQRLGRPAGDMDVLIAAVCLASAQSLLTRNPRHFADIPGLTVEAY
jgi:tRNA(fMet)-specific endonuclease VapC